MNASIVIRAALAVIQRAASAHAGSPAVITAYPDHIRVGVYGGSLNGFIPPKGAMARLRRAARMQLAFDVSPEEIVRELSLARNSGVYPEFVLQGWLGILPDSFPAITDMATYYF